MPNKRGNSCQTHIFLFSKASRPVLPPTSYSMGIGAAAAVAVVVEVEVVVAGTATSLISTDTNTKRCAS